MKNYGKDYKKSGDGYEYVGAWYETSLSAAELKKETKHLGGKLLAALILLVCGLTVNNIGSHTFWVLIPYAMMFLPVIYGVMGCAAMVHTAKKRTEQETSDADEHASHMRRSEYEQAFRRPLRCGIATAVLAWTSFAADVVIVTAYREQAVWTVELFFAADAFLLCILGVWMAAAAWRVHRSARRLEKNT